MRWRIGKEVTASQEAGNLVLEAIAIKTGEVLPRIEVENTEIDKCLRLHTARLNWQDGPATITIYLAKGHEGEGFVGKSWYALRASLRYPFQVLADIDTVREIYFEITYQRSANNPEICIPVAKIVRDQCRNCSGSLRLRECDCTNEECEFARKWNGRLYEILASNSAENRALRAKYGSPAPYYRK